MSAARFISAILLQTAIPDAAQIVCAAKAQFIEAGLARALPERRETAFLTIAR
jgi:hypothetical protein